MPPVGFEPTISAGERPQTYALERAAAGTGGFLQVLKFYLVISFLLISHIHSVILTSKPYKLSN
jgi:hypothetical protein